MWKTLAHLKSYRFHINPFGLLSSLRNAFWPHRYPFYQAQLEQISHRLLSLVHSSEQEFLSLGQTLQTLSSTSRQMYQQTKLALEKMSDTSDSNILGTIRHLLEEITGVLHGQSLYIEASFKQMNPISEKLYKLSTFREDFDKISRFLRILGISMKIESNRIGEPGQEFMVLGGEIDHVWADIILTTGELFSQAAGAANCIDSARNAVAANLEKYNTLTSQTRESIRLAMNEVEEMFHLSSRTIDRIAGCTQQISREIGEVVFSLQSHDITRQQVEHVHEALVQAGNRLQRLSTWTQKHDSSLVEEVSRILLVQIYQLENSIREMDLAGSKIRRSLTEIALRSEKENEEISAFYESTYDHKTGSMQRLEKEIGQLASILPQCEELSERISQILQPAIRSATGISESMIEMEKVGYIINLLSLNALVKAAQNQGSGQTFDILAEEIHQQANLSGHLAGEIRAELQILNKAKVSLEESLNLSKDQRAQADPIVRSAVQSVSRVQLLSRETSDTIFQLLEDNSRLSSEIKATAQHLQFDQLFRASACKSLEWLKAMYHELQRFCPHDAGIQGKDVNTGMESLANGYTMEKERDVHQQAVCEPHEEFQEQEEESCFAEEPVKAESAPGRDALGENIELF
ncbi:MAG: hypothetical protein ACMUIA_01320 [bacterium]